MSLEWSDSSVPRIVVVGGGFAGLHAVRRLHKTAAEVVLVDERNFHLFQPLLYQVAAGELTGGNIASPLRVALCRQKNLRTIMARVEDIDVERRRLVLADGEIAYDFLLLAAGSRKQFFGHPEWERFAPGLKTLEDAVEMRRRIYSALEMAERAEDSEERRRQCRFVVVGAGETGVELAGALGELVLKTVERDFRSLQRSDVRIDLVDALDRILTVFPEKLSERAGRYLKDLGVSVRTGVMVKEVSTRGVTLEAEGEREEVAAATVLWAAGVKASGLGDVLKRRTGARLDGGGRVHVAKDLSLPGRSEILVAGDLAHFEGPSGDPVPGTASAAIQMGRHAADVLKARIAGKKAEGFRYRFKGSLAVVGRNRAIAHLPFGRLRGFPAWLLWALVHIHYLVQFDSKIVVMFGWAWTYLTCRRGNRLILGRSPWDTGSCGANEKNGSGGE